MKKLFVLVPVLVALFAGTAMAEGAPIKKALRWHFGPGFVFGVNSGIVVGKTNHGRFVTELVDIPKVSFWSAGNGKVLLGKVGISLVQLWTRNDAEAARMPGFPSPALSMSPACFRLHNWLDYALYVSPTLWLAPKWPWDHRSVPQQAAGLEFSVTWN